MVTRTARQRSRDARYAARRAGNSRYVDWLARAGFIARGVMYALIGILRYALGLGAPKSSNTQAVDLTSTAMREPGGRIAVGIAGLVLIGVGAWLAWRAFERKFLAEIKTGEMSPQTRKVVTFLGRFGGIARGIVFGAAGLFLLIAAATAHAHQAKGIDATLRAFTKTPAGPWLLVLVAIGLVLFGCYSWAESRWRKV